MLKTDVHSLNHAFEEAKEWLDALCAKGPFANEQQAYSYLRVVLHAVRDRLTVEEAAHFAAQMPMLVRGFYYDGWRPAAAPNKDDDTVDAFLETVKRGLGNFYSPPPDISQATSAILSLLTERISEGQIRHVREQMPKEMQALWPA